MKLTLIFYFLLSMFLIPSSLEGAQAVVQQQKQILEQRQQQNNTRQVAPQGRTIPQNTNPNASGGYYNSEPQQYREEVVGMEQVLSELEISSEIWLSMIDDEAKVFVVDYYKDKLRAQGVILHNHSMHYVRFIDVLFHDNEDMLYQPFEELIRISAVMEYDYDNGVDPDLLARKILGEQVYLENKKRLGL